MANACCRLEQFGPTRQDHPCWKAGLAELMGQSAFPPPPFLGAAPALHVARRAACSVALSQVGAVFACVGLGWGGVSRALGLSWHCPGFREASAFLENALW
jgi:hypothetical protein